MIALAVPVLYLGAMLGAELLAMFVAPLGGIICYMVILVSLIVHSAVLKTSRTRDLYLALGMVPLVRIASIAIPATDVSLVYWYLIVAIPIVVSALTVAVVLKMRPSEVGLTNRAIGLQPLVAFVGIVIGLADYLILKPEPLTETLTWHEVLVPALILLAATGFAEELVFRGVLQRAALTLGSWGWVYVAVVFSVLQIGHHSVLHWLLALGMALLYGWIVKRTGSILGVSLAHGLVNIFLYLVFPFAL
ncbi:MAG: CPBP family intramembrane metalloprotease [Dehalococcoidia bacterium]|nr:CPBP family intramembrane metalloprotease [Dehalococcoidia bacterium]